MSLDAPLSAVVGKNVGKVKRKVAKHNRTRAWKGK